MNNYIERELKNCPFCGNVPSLDVMIRKDNDRYPRDHWHAGIKCFSCNSNQGWSIVSEQEEKEPDQKLIDKVVKQWNNRSYGL